jgi:hypothetical protein
MPDEGRFGHPLRVIDRLGHDGPWVITRRGYVGPMAAFSIRSGRRRLLHRVTRVEAVSQDGHRLVVQGEIEDIGWPSIQCHGIDLEAMSVQRLPSDYRSFLDPELCRITAARQLRKKFVAVGLDKRGGLALVTRRRRVVTIATDPGHPGSLRLVDRGGVGSLAGPPIEFTRIPGPLGTRFELREAIFPEGSRVYLDSRGLLHLHSSKETIPEITLALCDYGPLPAWCSDGAVCGHAYFLPDPVRSEPLPVLSNLARFLSKRW